MSDMEDYLQEGFDPRGVTMPRLRSILVTHNIEYPATAKKSQLVELVNEHVLPQVSKLRAQKAKAKRSSMGIVNAGSAEDTGAWSDYDLAPPQPPPSTRRSRSPRKASSRIKTEDNGMLTPAPRSLTKRSARSTSRQVSHDHDQEPPVYEPPQSIRRMRRTVSPKVQVKAEPKDEPTLPPPSPSPVQEESVFTYDNPFQGRSSPAPVVTPTNRRQAPSSSSSSDYSSSARSSSRQMTDNFSPDARMFQTPMQAPRTPNNYMLSPGEEFTPDEQLELEEAASRRDPEVEERRLSAKPARKSSFRTPFLVLLTALIGAYLAWYRQEKIAVGFCGLGRPAVELFPPEITVPDFLVPFVEPQCEPCPSHAYCYQDFSVRCEPDFILRPHPLSLGGLVPLPPTCEPDGEKARRVHAVADKAVEELRDRRARYECGDLVDDEGQLRGSPSIPEHELKERVSRKRSKRLNSEEFDELWAAAIGEVTARDEVEVTETEPSTDSPDLSDRTLASTSLARLPLTCAAKRSVRLGLARHRVAIGLLITSVLSVFYMRARYRKHVATRAQIPALVDLVLERLANQKELGEEDIDDPWLFLPNLRDDVLRSVHSLSERDRIWQRVKAVVEQNSNVRTSQREGRSGEVGRAWEWIGPIAGEGVRRRRSGRVSVGANVKAESPEVLETPEVKKSTSYY